MTGNRVKIGRNDPCPCGRLAKFKDCCENKFNWEALCRAGGDWRPHVSIRGRNLHFYNSMMEALGLASEKDLSLRSYKAAFSAATVRQLHELVLDVWPPNLDIADALRPDPDDVSGLYVGDYDREYLSLALVRHSVYANKILIVDPFIYARAMRDEYNPVLNPEQYRTMTLRNVNLWTAVMPWVRAGIVEIIRTPGDFDHRVIWESNKRQEEKFAANDELRKAAEITKKEMMRRHYSRMSKQNLLLMAPDDYILRKFEELGMARQGLTAEELLQQVQRDRDKDPDFLTSVDEGGQLQAMTSGTSYDMAQLTARLTGSYLVTDLHSKWREIELDRSTDNAEDKIWSPFAKAFQGSTLKCLNDLRMDHALTLRKEQRLESLRGFLLRVWRAARGDEEYGEENIRLLTEELKEEISKADVEWSSIHEDLVKQGIPTLITGGGVAAGLIVQGKGFFAAAASGAATLALAGAEAGLAAWKRIRLPHRHPAAFFLNLSGKK
jgi:hypothetical protein